MPDQPMNVLVLMCDQLRYDAISFFGHGRCRTPNLDRLAAQSVRFHNAVTNAPLCGPARHSLATGLYPARHGVVNNIALPFEGMRTIAHHFKELGYASRCFGHMHWQRLPGTEGDTFTDHGYDYEAITESVPADRLEARRWEHLGQTSDRVAGPSCLDRHELFGSQVADASCRRLREDAAAGRAFLNWTSFNEPHPPFFSPPEFWARQNPSTVSLPVTPPEDAPPPADGFLQHRQPAWDRMSEWDHRVMRAGYYALAEFADHCVGRVLDELDRQGLMDQTIIVFTADHGEMLGDHGLYYKSVFRQPAVHIPLMIRHPHITPGDREQLSEHVDIFPTLCDLLGLPIPQGLDGRSLRPLLMSADAAPVRTHAFSHLKQDAMIRNARWKLVYYDGQPGELYDLRNDPLELVNRIDDPACRSQRRGLESAFAERFGDTFERTRAIEASGRLRRKKRKPAITLEDVE